ncbi:hypothetical protein NUU61_007184 [Penicillium alfredii]|uniref:Mitochondrial mRNA processing protein PET127 n=1 Tax=Penicillium alfredii TaxID=1506179 RepID=A0A9W9F2D5_9EURO|nr:uncharacterized protein NUU61_007184 [Penicillium alfredii]KAJ5092314.1 hypothetical protein NUU61_007184 [Penicillium alfredii]
MFRVSLRSVAGPHRHHVCFSCLAGRAGAPARLRQFHSATPLPAESQGETSETKSENTSIQLQDFHSDHAPSKDTKNHDRAPKQPPQNGKPHKFDKKRKTDGEKKTLPPKWKAEAGSEGKTREPGDQKKTTKTSTQDGSNQEQQTDKKPFSARVARLLDETAQPKKKPSKRSARSDAERRKAAELDGPSSLVNKKETGSMNSADRTVSPLDIPTPPVPRLSFGLDRVLFNPGVYQLRDPRSRVYNFDPYLGSIMPVTEFDFDALKEYITSSKDETLRNIAVQQKKKYVGSSSSMTSVLSHFHYLLSGWRSIDTRTLSQGFTEPYRSFTRLNRSPAAMFLHYQDGTYAIDADKEFDSANILMNLGKSMEKLLTLPKDEFERYRRSSDNKISPEEEKAIPESYHYSTAGDFIMRSQLDAYDPRLPGTGMFDLKTRAVVSIRMDAKNFEHGLGYEIKNRYGNLESYEREFFDMIRAAFLKYSLQVRVGRMDGIFVAFHNVERIFGFQYISLPEMDLALHGQTDTTLGNREVPKQSLRFHFETRDSATPFMYIFAEPVTQEDIHAIQTKNQAEIEAYQKRILNPTPDDADVDLESESPVSSESEDQTSESSISSSSNSPSPADEYVGAAPEQSGEEEANNREILAMVLSVKHKVNDNPVERPKDLTASDKWTVDYELSELGQAQGWSLYRMCQARREKQLVSRGEDEFGVAGNAFLRTLRALSKAGREHRKQENQVDRDNGVVQFTDPVD